ncbi:MAG: hypothetical protein Q9191_006168 [Dirinaria sp. TL-2023a]
MATMTISKQRHMLDGSDSGLGHARDISHYDKAIDTIREEEYPMLKGTTYLDHAGTTPYAKSLVQSFSRDMMTDLLGNPHSASSSSQTSTRRIENVRLRVLQFFKADPDDYEVIFVANATAGIKLVSEAFRADKDGFWYGYHKDAHTSLVGARELSSSGHHCFESDAEIENWLSGKGCPDGRAENSLRLFAYPAQSNMNGRRLPLSWPSRVRALGAAKQRRLYTLIDAAALVSTSPLDLSNPSLAPDFTVLSFYKIFGFPDLGALIVRKEAGHVLECRQYFGGGTVELVACLQEQWHIKKQTTLAEQFEDGTLPVHSIIALDSALNVHTRLFKSMEHVSSHTAYLAKQLYKKLSRLRHFNGRQVCTIYKAASASYDKSETQGPILAFNLRNSQGEWISNAEVEKLANIQNIQLRTGGLCNPGGIAGCLDLAPWEMMRNFSAGQRCGGDNFTMGGKPAGVIRVSLGAMSNARDIQLFLSFIEEFFVDRQSNLSSEIPRQLPAPSDFYVESLTVYPVKSCGGWSIPSGTAWSIKPEGLAWDREWCLVHQGTRDSLSQKRYPEMALIKPSIDFSRGLLRVRYQGRLPASAPHEISVPLSADPTVLDLYERRPSPALSTVCGDSISANTYASKNIASFFTNILGTPCTLARLPPSPSSGSGRHSKAHLQPHQISHLPSGEKPAQPTPTTTTTAVSNLERPILLSNESPILTITRSSLDALNTDIARRNPTAKIAHHSVFRANIVLAQDSAAAPQQPYVEDTWRYMHIFPQQGTHGGRTTTTTTTTATTTLEMLGSCRRCQMVCVDQTTAEKNEEPFATLAKTRRIRGKVWFGVHGGLARQGRDAGGSETIMVGDRVVGSGSAVAAEEASGE